MNSRDPIDVVNIKAVHDKDLRAILDKFGLSEKIDDNSLRCEFCYQPISWNDIGALFIKEGKIIICCKLIECINHAAYLTEDGRPAQ